jgi:hypothetical protein
MTLQDKIHRDLKAGQSSADALALRFGKTKQQCEMVLKRMEDEGLVFSFYIDCGIEVWRLRPAQKKSLP